MPNDGFALARPAGERHLDSLYWNGKVLAGGEEHLFGLLIGRFLAGRVACRPTAHTVEPGCTQVVLLRGSQIAFALSTPARLLERLCGGAVCLCPFFAIQRAETGENSLVILIGGVVKRINPELRCAFPVLP